MKKFIYSMVALLGLSACSSEQMALQTLQVTDVSNTACKGSFSKTESRPNYYTRMVNTPITLQMLLNNNGVATCKFEDVLANCAVQNLYVRVKNEDRMVTLYIYYTNEEIGNCLCNYDIDFKVSKLIEGDYQLKVYYAYNFQKEENFNLIYNGGIHLEKNKRLTLQMK